MIVFNDDNTITIEINLEGKKYNLEIFHFIGNSYSDNELNQKLKIKQNDIFDQSILNSRNIWRP